MAERMQLWLELMGRSGNLRGELNSTKGAVRSWGTAVRSEFRALRGMAGSLSGKLAALGIGFSAVRVLSDSAKLDKSLTRTKQTAGATAREMALLRRELFAMARKTGQPVESLVSGFDGLVAGGLNFKSALEAIKAINIGSAVSGVDPVLLASALKVGAKQFDFDLSKPGVALELLDKMRVAGNQGNAELNKLSDVFSRVGANSSAAGLSIDQTLAFVEGLSQFEEDPERLGTLVDSTLRVFTNLNYLKSAQKATKIRFFDSNGQRREAFAVIEDIKKRYDKLTTDQQRDNFVQKAFGAADQDTIRGMRTFLEKGILTDVLRFTSELKGAGGTLKGELDEATSNLVDQVSMLKNDLRAAADAFVQPMSKTLTDWIKWARENKANGGGGLDGTRMLGYGTAGVVGGGLAMRYVPMVVNRMFRAGGSLAGGMVAGKAMEEFAGVTPVFVVNMPGGGFGGKIGGAEVGAGAGAGAASASSPGKVQRLFSGGAEWVKRVAPLAAASATRLFAPMAPAAIGAAAASTSEAFAKHLAQRQIESSSPERLQQLRAQHMVMGGGENSWQVREITEAMREVSRKNERPLTINIRVDGNGRVVTDINDPSVKTKVNAMRRGDLSPMASH